MTAEELCKKIEREQGFIVITHSREMAVGSVDSHCLATRGGEALPPLKVLGVATRDEWLTQRRRYHSGEDPEMPESPFFYYRCMIAEARQ